MNSIPPAVPHPYVRPPRPDGASLVAPRELRRWIESPEPPTLLDIRGARERRTAHLPHDRHVPLEELAGALPSLPRGSPIVVYDHFGFQSRRAAAFLEDHGFAPTAALEGGLDEYSRVADPSVPRYSDDGHRVDLVLRQLPRLETGCLSYFVGDALSREALVIDPGREVDPYRRLLAEGDWHLAGIVETHTHADHLAGHSALHRSTDAPIFLSARSPAEYPHRRVSEGESVPFGGEELVVLETPGHTRDHLTLRLRGQVFTGDTLLLGSCGRTDLGDGSPDLLYESLTDKILRLPPETEVYPAHYGAHHALPERYVSTIGFERATNEALGQPDRAAFLRYMTEGWPPKPASFDAIVHENLVE